MPAIRSVRRSRRLSKRPPTDPSESGWEEYDLDQLETQNAEVDREDVRPAEKAADSDDDAEPFALSRAPHSKKKRDGHIPRPPNAFMIFRSELWVDMKSKPKLLERDHRRVSRIAGMCWNGMSEEQRAPYVLKAAIAKEEHQKKYPHYKFSPVAKGKAGKRRNHEDAQETSSRCKAIARLLLEGGQAKDKSVKSAPGLIDEHDRLLAADPSQGGQSSVSGKNSKGKARAIAQRRSESQPSTPLLDTFELSSPGPSTPPALSSPSSQNSSPPSSPELREQSPTLEYPSDFVHTINPSILHPQSMLLFHEHSDVSNDLGSTGLEPTSLRLDQLYPPTKDTTYHFSSPPGSPVLGADSRTYSVNDLDDFQMNLIGLDERQFDGVFNFSEFTIDISHPINDEVFTLSD